MAPALVTTHTVEVEAPDGAAALELERRLVDLAPTAVWRRGRWMVDVPAARRVADVEAEVADWLRRIGGSVTTMHVDGEPVRVSLPRRPSHRGTHADFIG